MKPPHEIDDMTKILERAFSTTVGDETSINNARDRIKERLDARSKSYSPYAEHKFFFMSPGFSIDKKFSYLRGQIQEKEEEIKAKNAEIRELKQKLIQVEQNPICEKSKPKLKEIYEDYCPFYWKFLEGTSRFDLITELRNTTGNMVDGLIGNKPPPPGMNAKVKAIGQRIERGAHGWLELWLIASTIQKYETGRYDGWRRFLINELGFSRNELMKIDPTLFPQKEIDMLRRRYFQFIK